MKPTENGVLKNSEIYFSSPSPAAEKLYYYPICAGHFFCTSNYHLRRANYNSLLITHVISGSFTFMENGKPVTAREGETVLLNCFEPHEYFTDDEFESVWVHVAGLNCRDLYEEITRNEGCLLKCSDPARVEKLLFRIFNELSAGRSLSEMNISLEIYKLFTELANPLHISSKNKASYEESVQEAKKYISEHLSENLTVKTISSVIHMSQSHFSRVFKQQTGFSPYDYVLITRLNRAKDYLQKTELTISEIAYEAGFNSESNFIYFFTTNTGISPSKFRKLKF